MVSSRDSLSSKELIERTGISRSTLNNYISLGLLPKPVVRPAHGKDGRAPRMGYFPRDALDVLRRINALKRKGRSIAEIVGMVGARTQRVAEPQRTIEPRPSVHGAGDSSTAPRPPYLTPLGVLVADIEDSATICAELPPEDYFELINDVWAAAAPLLRKYSGTCGKHAAGGMVCYFLPQPKRDYVLNAIHCAIEMTEAVREIGRRLRARGSWTGELELNIGLDEGEAWLGTWRTPDHLELVALGEAVSRGARLGDFARGGSMWATKTMLGKLPAALRARVRYGIRRRTEDGEAVIVPASFARVSSLIEPGNARTAEFEDIAEVPVTEIFDLVREAPAGGG